MASGPGLPVRRGRFRVSQRWREQVGLYDRNWTGKWLRVREWARPELCRWPSLRFIQLGSGRREETPSDHDEFRGRDDGHAGRWAGNCRSGISDNLPTGAKGFGMMYIQLEVDIGIQILTHAFLCAQPAPRAVFHSSPAFQLGLYFLRCFGLPRPRRGSGSESRCPMVGDHIVLDPRASVHPPFPCTVSVLE